MSKEGRKEAGGSTGGKGGGGRKVGRGNGCWKGGKGGGKGGEGSVGHCLTGKTMNLKVKHQTPMTMTKINDQENMDVISNKITR